MLPVMQTADTAKRDYVPVFGRLYRAGHRGISAQTHVAHSGLRPAPTAPTMTTSNSNMASIIRRSSLPVTAESACEIR